MQNIRSAPSAQRWRELSACLDHALDLPEDLRRTWLADLCARDPALGEELRCMLADTRVHALGEVIENTARHGFANAHDLDLVGTQWGAYRIEALIGQGGMGSVWLARRSDGQYDGQAALKIMNAALLGSAQAVRMQGEGRALARLNHPHIARLLDAGASPAGLPYLVLEYIEGERIDRFCNGRRLDLRARVALLLEVTAAVSHAHAHLVVHRDIKPSNVLVTTQGQAKLLDFGIAKLLSDAGAGADPDRQPPSRLMTPEFAAPEQLRGEPATAHTDVYALGTLLYMLLTGRHPSGQNQSDPAQLIHAVAHGDAVRASAAVAALAGPQAQDCAAQRSTTPRRLREQLEGDLDIILARALKREPHERYASAVALAEDLRRWLAHEPIAARADSPVYVLCKFTRRHRLACAAVAVALITTVGGVAATLHQARVAADEAVRASAAQGFVLDLFNENHRVRPDPTQARLTTARELLDLGAARVDAAFATSPRARMDVCAALAGMYANLGLQKEAAQLWHKAAQAAQQAPEVDASLRVRAQLGEARAADLAGAPAQRDALLDALQPALAAAGADPLQRAELALLQARRHLSDAPLEAARLAHAATQAFEAAGAPADALRAMQVQGSALSVSSRWEEAATVLNQALVQGAQAAAQTPQDRVKLLGMLGTVREYQGRRHEAVELLRQALELSGRANGANHPDTATIHLRLGLVLANLGRLDEAIAQERAAAQALEQAARDGDAAIMPDVQVMLGSFLVQHGEVEEGVEQMRRGVALRASSGRKKLALAANQHDLAIGLVEAGQIAEAQDVLARADEIARGVKDASDLDVSAADAWLTLRLAQADPAALREALGRHVDACARAAATDPTAACNTLIMAHAIEAALVAGDPRGPQWLASARQRLAGLDAPSVSPLDQAGLLLLEGRYALRGGDARAAVPPLRQAVRLFERALDVHSLQLADARMWLARALTGQGDLAEARALGAQARQAQAAHPGVPMHSRRDWAEAPLQATGRS